MKKIHYCIIETIEVDDDITQEEIDDLIAQKADGKDYMWSEKDNLLD